MAAPRQFQWFTWLACLCADAAKQDVWLTAIQPFTGADWDAGISMQIGGQIMLEEINNHPGLLPNYNLRVVWQDGLCAKNHGNDLFLRNMFNKEYDVFAPGKALSELNRDGAGMITTADVAPFQVRWNETNVKPDPIGLLGSGCSGAAIEIANFAWRVRFPMISNSATRPTLSDRSAFPYFYRTIMPDTFFNDAWVAMAKQLGHDSVVVVIGETQNWASMGTAIVETAKKMGVKLAGHDLSGEIPGFSGLQMSIDSASAAKDIATELKHLKQRIVIFHMFAARMRLVMCAAYQQKFFNAVFMVMGWLAFGWWDSTSTACTAAQLTYMANWFISANGQLFRFDQQTQLSCSQNMTAEGWTKEWYTRQGKAVGDLSPAQEGYAPSKEATTTADAVCMYAQMLHKILEVDQSFPLADLAERTPAAWTAIQKELQDTDFEGVSGRMRFETNSADPKGGVIVQQLHAEPGTTAKIVDLGTYSNGAFTFFGTGRAKFHFPGEDYEAGPAGVSSITAPLAKFKTCSADKTFNYEDNSCICGPGMLLVGGSCVCDKGSAPSEATGGALCGPCSKGRFAETAGKPTCDKCPSGQFANATGMTKCHSCGIGTFSGMPGAAICVSCMPGFMQGKSGQTACDKCAKGTFSNASSDRCIHCAPGTASESDGSGKCEPCLKGFFAKSSGQTSCERVPAGNYMDTRGATGYASCQSVIAGSTTLFPGAGSPDDCICLANTYLGEQLHGQKECFKCSEGMDCSDDDMKAPRTAAGFYINEQTTAKNPGDVYLCEPPEACLGAPWGSEGCRAPRYGFMCMDCPAGKALNTDFEINPDGCVDCSGAVTAFVVLAPLVALCCCLTIMYFTHESPLSESPLTMEMQNTIGQLIMFFQVSNAIFATRMLYGEPMDGFMKSVVSNFDTEIVFGNAPCLGSSFAGAVLKYATVIIAPVFAMIVMGFVYAVTKICGAAAKKMFSLDSLLNIFGEVLVEFYISITLAIFRPFQCYSHPDTTGKSSVLAYPEVLCGENDWNSQVGLAVFGIIAYPLSAMCIAAFMTWQHPRAMLRNELSILVRGRFLFDRWTPSCYWFCNISLIRNFLVAVLPCIMPEDQLDVTILLMTLTLIWALVMLVWYKPRRTPQQQRLDTAISVVQLTLLSFGVTSVSGTPLRRSLSTACVIFIITVVMSVILLIAFRAYQMVMKTVSHAIYLSHHGGNGGTSTRVLQNILNKVVQKSVFYDMDHQSMWGVLFDAVRVSDNVLVVFGSASLCRPWSIAAVVCAYRRGTPLHRIIFVNPKSEDTVAGDMGRTQSGNSLRTFTGKVPDKSRSSTFEVDTFMLRGYGLDQKDVHPAISAITCVDPILMNFLSEHKVNVDVNECLQGMVGLKTKASVQSATEELFRAYKVSQTPVTCPPKGNLIMIDHTDGEAVAVSRLFSSVFSLIGHWLEDQDLSTQAFAETVRGGNLLNVVFVFSQNTHQSLSQLARLGLLYKRQSEMHMVPVAVGVTFDFPDEDYFKKLEMGTALDFGGNPSERLSTMAGGDISPKDIAHGLAHTMSYLVLFINVPDMPHHTVSKALTDLLSRATGSGRRNSNSGLAPLPSSDAPQTPAGGGGGFGGGGGSSENQPDAALAQKLDDCDLVTV